MRPRMFPITSNSPPLLWKLQHALDGEKFQNDILPDEMTRFQNTPTPQGGIFGIENYLLAAMQINRDKALIMSTLVNSKPTKNPKCIHVQFLPSLWVAESSYSSCR